MATEEDKEEMKEVTVRLAAAKEINVDAVLAAVLSEVDCIFKIKEHITPLKASFVRNMFSL